MMCLMSNSNKFMKKTLLDVWGHHISYFKLSKAINFMRSMRAESSARKWYYNKEFIYTFESRMRFSYKAKFKRFYMSPRYVSNFFLILKSRDYRKYFVNARHKSGSMIQHFLMFMECRLFMILYRSNFVTNLFLLKSMIELGFFMVNNRVENYCNFMVKLNDIVHVLPKYNNMFFYDICFRFLYNNIMWNVPKYLYVNYKLMMILLISRPRLKELPYPMRLDLFLGGAYFM